MINGKRIVLVLPACNAEKPLGATVRELPVGRPCRGVAVLRRVRQACQLRLRAAPRSI
jgi:hypothetical protein